MSSLGSQKLFSIPKHRPALMGILNVTPDSFSDGGLHFDFEVAVQRGLEMITQGADLIDVGGESTRPGAEPVSIEEEIKRTEQVVKELAGQEIPVSIDTMKWQVAEAALDAGAFLVNDVSGLRDPQMVELVQSRDATVCIMHMQGTPRNMQHEPEYGDVVAEVRQYLLGRAESLDLSREKIWIDPGIGFGKTLNHNLELLRNLESLTKSQFPVLIGVSRKSFIGRLLAQGSGQLPPEARLEGTLAVQTIAQIKGAKIIRAHDVRDARRVIDVTAAIMAE